MGLLVVDIVTSRQANLHNELVALVGVGDEFRSPPGGLYATAYRPLRRPDAAVAQVWFSELSVGRPLPTMPLALDKSQIIPVDLDATYVESCQRSRLA